MPDILVRRYEQYFRHADHDHEVLRVGDRAAACANVRQAIRMLGVESCSGSQADDDVYDEALRNAVEEYQVRSRHRVADGLVGPDTRTRIASDLLHQFSPSIFARLQRPASWGRQSVFVTYASADAATVNKVDQWLRDQGVRVLRDCEYFVAGATIQDNIERAVANSDKILAVFSRNSRDRDWPRLERSLAKQLETKLGAPVLIYLCIDDAELPAHDSTRLAIRAQGKTLKQVGQEILHAVSGAPLQHWQHTYDEDEPL